MPAHAARSKPGDVGAVEQHAPGIGAQIAGDDVDEGGLAGAVVADETQPFAAARGDRDVLGGDDRAEGFLQALGFQKRGHLTLSTGFGAGFTAAAAAAPHQRANPSGRNRMTSRRNMPSAPCQVFGKYWLENERTSSRSTAATNTAVTLA